MKDVRLTNLGNGTYDLMFENGETLWAEDGTQAAQNALIRLLTFYGEDDYAPTKGTKWFETIFKASKSRAEKEFEIKKIILQTPGIKTILEFTWTQSGHVVTIDGTVQTDWGEAALSDTLELL